MARLFYTDHYQFPLPDGHKFPLRKYRLLRELLGQYDGFDLAPAPLADVEAIVAVHDQEYVRGFLDGTLDTAVMRRIGLPWSPELVQRTLASVGATLAACEVAAKERWSGTLAGGTHHAFRSEGAGYCVFNDLAVAVEHLRRTGAAHRVAIVDLDVHQGDGTAQMFENDPDTLTLSMHGRKNFPFRKQRSKIDVELEDGTADSEYLAALEWVLPQVAESRPEFILYQAGVDPLDSDRLGRLKVSMQGLGERDRQVFTLARELRVPIVITLGGGYSDPIERTAEAHAQTFRMALQELGSGQSHH